MRIASRATALSAMPIAAKRSYAPIAIARSTCAGASSAHAKACMPPSEPPTTAAKRAKPSSPSASRCARTMSNTETSGKRSP